MKVKSIVALMALLIASLMVGTAAAQDNGVSWGSLSDGQREVLGQLQDSWDDLTPERQQRLSKGAERWSGMSPRERKEARKRFSSWRELSDERRDQIRERAQVFRICRQTRSAEFAKTIAVITR